MSFNTVSFTGRNDSGKYIIPKVIYTHYDVASSKRIPKSLRVAEEDVYLMKKDYAGKPISGLSRTLSIDEAIMAREIPKTRLQEYIDLIDRLLTVDEAEFIARSPYRTKMFKKLTTKNENGKPHSGASRILDKDEAIAFIISISQTKDDSRLEPFIYLKDIGLNNTDAINISHKNTSFKKFIDITTKDDKGNPKSGASRTMTNDEALIFMYSNLVQSKAKNYIDLIDAGINPSQAIKHARSEAETKLALKLIKSNNNGATNKRRLDINA